MNPDPACMVEEFVLLSNRLLLKVYFDGELTLQTLYRKRNEKKTTRRGDKIKVINILHEFSPPFNPFSAGDSFLCSYKWERASALIYQGGPGTAV